VKVFDDARGKWRVRVPEVAASLLVSLSARLLRWQNPGEAYGDLVQILAAKCRELPRRFSLLARSLRSYATSLRELLIPIQRNNMQSP
jgi:hypothetical protein